MSRNLTQRTNVSVKSSYNVWALNKQNVVRLIKALLDPNLWESIQNVIQKPIENVYEFMVLPFDYVSTMGLTNVSPTQVYIGNKDLTGDYGNVTGLNITNIMLSKNIVDGGSITIPLSSFGEVEDDETYIYEFLNYEPYTKISLYIPCYGFIEMSPSECMGATLKLKYSVDFTTGDAVAYITKEDYSEDGYYSDAVIKTVPVKLGVTQPITQDNSMFKSLTTTIGVMGQVASVAALSTGSGVAASVASNSSTTKGSLTQLLNSGNRRTYRHINDSDSMSINRSESNSNNRNLNVRGDLPFDVVNSILNYNAEHISKGNIGNGFSGWNGSDQMFAIVTRPMIKVPGDYEVYYGRPLNEISVLSDLEGYTKVDSIHLEGFRTATSNELEEIESLLKQGVIL